MTNQAKNNGLDTNLLRTAYDSLRPEQRERLETEVKEICYDRTTCAFIGADYNTLNGNDMLKVYKHAMERLGYLTSE